MRTSITASLILMLLMLAPLRAATDLRDLSEATSITGTSIIPITDDPTSTALLKFAELDTVEAWLRTHLQKVNGLTVTSSTGTLTITNGKTLSVSNSVTLSGTDGTTMTFPSTSATLARTDAANTFTGTQTIGALVVTTVNGNTISTGTGTLTLGAGKTFTASNTVTLSGTDGSTVSFGAGGTIAYVGAANAWADNVRQTFNPGADAAGLNVGAQASDPGTPSNGDLFYDSDDNLLRARINGAWVNLGAAGGAIAGTDTHVLFFDGADSPAGDAGFTYNKTTDSATLAGSLTVVDDAYDATGWNGSALVPTKNAVRDKIAALAQADISGLTTASSPEFTGVNVGHASDTTITRGAAGYPYAEGKKMFTESKTTADDLQAPQIVTLTSSSTDTYAGTAGVTATAYTTGTTYVFVANTANTGACSLNIDSLGAKTIKKVAGGITTDLSDNDIRNGQVCVVSYDGTNFQLQSTLGNAASGGSGAVVAVKYVAKTDTFTTSSTSMADLTGLSITYTPTSSSNVILVEFSGMIQGDPGVSAFRVNLVRDSTVISQGDSAGSRIRVTCNIYSGSVIDTTSGACVRAMDAPGDTSSHTYKVQVSNQGSGTLYVNRTSTDTDSSTYTRGTCILTIMEVTP